MAAVLLVEDEPFVRRFITDALNDAGHAVHAVQNAEVALVILEEGVRFDLLITDIMLPWGIDGVELADRARRLQPDLGVIYVTGFARRNLSALHGTLLTKPMRISELLAAVKGAVAEGDARRAPPAAARRSPDTTEDDRGWRRG